MKISVALATYNGARFIGEQLASIAGQSRQPDELVVSDDGSTDDTLAIVSAFAKTVNFPVTIVPKTERLGFADNFLYAVEHCRYDLVALCDQDDVWLPDKLKIGAERLMIDGSLLSMHTLNVTDEALNPTGFELQQGITGDALIPPLALNPFGTGWGNTMIFHRALALLVRREDRPSQPFKRMQSLSHDTWLFALAAALGSVSQIGSPLVLYRQHDATATQDARRVRRNVIVRALQVPLAEYRERHWFDREMARLMKDIASADGQFAAEAHRAHERFVSRCEIWDARVDALAGSTLAIRIAGYRRHQCLAGVDQHWLGSRIKDILLGVSGIARRLETIK